MIVWTAESLEAFRGIKTAIGRWQLLSFLKTDRIGKDSIVILCTDASLYGMGGVLLQIVAGQEFIIGLASKSFDATQQRWPTIEQELYASVFCMMKWEPILVGGTLHATHGSQELNLPERVAVTEGTQVEASSPAPGFRCGAHQGML